MTHRLLYYHQDHPCGTFTDVIFLHNYIHTQLDYTSASQHLDPLHYLVGYYLFWVWGMNVFSWTYYPTDSAKTHLQAALIQLPHYYDSKIVKIQLITPCSTRVFFCFFCVFLKEWSVNLTSSIALYRFGDNTSSRVRYSYLSILPNDNADLFVAALLMWYCNFSSLILSLMFMTTPSKPSNKFIKESRVLSDGRVVSVTKNEYGFALKFLYSLLNSSKSM